MNRFDNYISDYLLEHKEVTLERIGTIKIPANFSPQDEQSSVEFNADKKAVTTDVLATYISEKEKKSRSLIASDLESHLSQVREYINIGKSYEIPNIGFIKANKAGVYEYLPYSEVNKSIRISSLNQPSSGSNKPPQRSNKSFVQIITLIIVLAILAGLGYEVYQFFVQRKSSAVAVVDTTPDSLTTQPVQDTTPKVDSTKLVPQTKTYAATDTVNVRYIFETTASGLRARTRTTQLKGFGNNAGYDSGLKNNTMYYSLFITKATLLSDTAKVRDSIGKYLQKDITIQFEPVK